MLYIKFNIQDLSKYNDFQQLYQHMVATRQPDFEFESEDPLNFDWDHMTDEEMSEAFEKMHEQHDESIQEAKRYKKLIPEYADSFLTSYIEFDHQSAGAFGFDKSGIFNYLEFSFEVDMDKLEKLNETSGIVEFSTGNYPFGGIERFLMVLKAFDLQPIECFNGFSIVELVWLNNFEYDTIELPEKTKIYVDSKNK